MNKKLLFNILTSILMLMFGNKEIFSQNIAINTSGAAASAMLDISSSTSGLLIPRIALTATNAAGPIVAPTTSLVIYNTATAGVSPNNVIPGYYYWDGAAWNRMATGNGTGWITTGNAGTTASTSAIGVAVNNNFIGTTDTKDFVFATNNLERMRITSGGNIGIGVTAPAYLFNVLGASGTYLARLENSNTAGATLLGYNTGAAGAGFGNGVVGITSQNQGFGIYGANFNATGTGAIFYGNNIGGGYLAGGSGDAATGITTGSFIYNTSIGTSQAIYSNNGGVICRVNYYNALTFTQYKILGTGAVSTTVNDVNDKPVIMHCPESPEIYYTDCGQGQLINGRIHIELDPTYAKNIAVNEKHPMRVYIQLEDNEACKGVVVKNKTSNSFDVVELGGGTSNTPFQYQIICNAADQQLSNGRLSKNADLRFEPAPKDEPMVERKNSIR